MSLEVECGECGARYNVPEEKQGRRIRCKKCGNAIPVAEGGSGRSAAPAGKSRRRLARAGDEKPRNRRSKPTDDLPAAPVSKKRKRRPRCRKCGALIPKKATACYECGAPTDRHPGKSRDHLGASAEDATAKLMMAEMALENRRAETARGFRLFGNRDHFFLRVLGCGVDMAVSMFVVVTSLFMFGNVSTNLGCLILLFGPIYLLYLLLVLAVGLLLMPVGFVVGMVMGMLGFEEARIEV